jgi:hypothetical protein
MNACSRVPNIRAAIAAFALIASAASSGAAPASAPVIAASSHSPPFAEHVSDADSAYDGPHVRMLFFVLFAAVGYTLHRQQRALESLHTLQNVS